MLSPVRPFRKQSDDSGRGVPRKAASAPDRTGCMRKGIRPAACENIWKQPVAAPSYGGPPSRFLPGTAARRVFFVCETAVHPFTAPETIPLMISLLKMK